MKQKSAAKIARKGAAEKPLTPSKPQKDALWWSTMWGTVGGQMLAISVALLLARMVYLQWFTPYGLAPDEAQYWSWLQNNDWSFLSKPPLTTWAMGLSTAVLGDTVLGVKFFALLAQAMVPLLGASIARELAPENLKTKAAWLAFAGLSTLPLIAAGGLIMAPDALLLPLWLGALLAVVRGVGVPESRALCWPRWLIVGTLIGLAGLAKYSAVLFFPLLGLWLLWQRPQWLKRPQIWLSGLLALALQAPVLHWNYINGWAGLHHVLWQAEGDSRHGGLATLGDFLGGQALVLGPLGLILMLLAWGSALRQGKQMPARASLLVVLTLPIFLGFLAQTLGSKVQANWPLLATVPAMSLAAIWLASAKVNRLTSTLVAAGLALNMFLSLALYNTHLIRPILPYKIDPTKDLMGWQEMGELLGGALQRLDNPLVLGVRYQTLAPLAFHTTPPADWFYWNAEGRRATDYDDWNWPQSLPNRPVVLVKESPDFPVHVTELFQECRPWHALGTEQHGVQVRRLFTWLCWGYRERN
jgi:4-amino-4-deoxy-L-arabinose transferase-like glycosyltransferase